MIDMSYADIQEKIANLSNDLADLNVAILRNITLEPIEPYLKYLAFQSGWKLNVSWGSYNQIFQEVVADVDGLINNNLDFIFIFHKLEVLSPNLVNNFTSMNEHEIEDEVSRIIKYMSSIFEAITTKASAQILCNSFELPVFPAYGIREAQIENGQLGIINELNMKLRRLVGQHRCVDIIDFNQLCMRVGANDFYDFRYWHLARSPYSRDGLNEIATEIFKIVRAHKGKNKKCLILDCDNTLWGGIIGEDGLDNIKLGADYPGSCYSEFQMEVLQLYNKGVIIALCSKNNEEDVWQVFKEHSNMILKKEHIAATQINWDDKSTNIRRLSEDLNIGLDSMVFVDDSDFEVNLIRELLPMVSVLHIPIAKMTMAKELLSQQGYFDSLTYSIEDRKRGAMYKAEAERKEIKKGFTTLDDYLKSLEMKVEISIADAISIPRIAQLTQKTNQFNLTTRRYTEADIKSFCDNDNIDVIYVKLKDKFGEYGIIGASIIRFDAGIAEIDSFLLSCRALGREVEVVFLQSILKYIRELKIEKAVGLYLPTRKNMQTKDFYSNFGFEHDETMEPSSFVFETRNLKEKVFDYYHRITLNYNKKESMI